MTEYKSGGNDPGSSDKNRDQLKIRIAGDHPQVERMTELLRTWSKQWGKRKIFSVRRYRRQPSFSHSLGKATNVNYVKMKLPKPKEGGD